ADRDGLTAGPADRLQAVGGAIVALDSGLGHMSENPPERARCLEARRHRPSGHAAEAERQIAALAGLQRQPVTRFGKTA
ncbi:hypothetical protein, partial [Collinsella sp. HCP3S3_E5]|uniref:hypothetical protein n=1 Tax=Collinsella sp. HCP3S3_E5 TaxID=3438936 RepID=UPI003F8A99B2